MLASIQLFTGNFAPRGWAFCDGQILPISQNTALFSLLGTTYGGDGRTTFALPDLRGRAPIGPRTGHGLTPRRLGELGGQEEHTLITPEMPSHTHIATATSGGGGTAPIDATATLHADSTGATNNPDGKFIANVPNVGPNTVKSYGGTADIEMATDAVTVSGTVNLATIPAPSVAVGTTGGGLAHNNMQPFLAVNYIIAITGYFPTRS